MYECKALKNLIHNIPDSGFWKQFVPVKQKQNSKSLCSHLRLLICSCFQSADLVEGYKYSRSEHKQISSDILKQFGSGASPLLFIYLGHSH